MESSSTNWLEGEISTRRRALEAQQQSLISKEAELNSLKGQLDAISTAKGPRAGTRKKAEKVDSLEKLINEGTETISKARKDIEDKQRAIKGLEEGLAALMEKEAAQTEGLESFPHKKFRHGDHQTIGELQTSLETKEALIQLMKGQLRALESENGPDVNNVNCQHQENLFKLDPIKSALSTPEIWRKIFGKLDNSALMASRLVAKSWNKRVLKIFANTSPNDRYTCGSYLCLTNLLQTSTQSSEKGSDFESEFPAYDPKLPATIIFQDFRGDKCCDFSRYKCLTLCSQFSSQISRLDLQTIPTMATTLFNEMVNKGCFPNLESFKLSFDAGSRYFYSEEYNTDCKLTLLYNPNPSSLRKKLQHIDITVGLWDKLPKLFQARLQALIDTAPNLKKLTIKGNFYPDLNKNEKLEELHIRYKFNNNDFSQFSKLLDQVKNFVKIAELEAALPCETGRQKSLPCRFPVMKKLKSLKLHDSMIHSLEQDRKHFVSNIATNFPVLQNLRIIKDFHYNNDSVTNLLNCQGPQTTHLKLQSLGLTYIKNPSDLRHLAAWFPNLKSLKVSFSRVADETTALLLTGLGGLQLKELQLTIQYLYVLKLSQLIKALTSHPALFNGMEHLEIIAKVQQRRFPEPYPVATTDDLDRKDKDGKSLSGMRQVFCDWLESTTLNMKCVLFRGFTFSRRTASEVRSVIRRKKLPVKLIENYCEGELFEIN